MSLVRAIATVVLVIVLLVVGGAIYALRRPPTDGVAGRVGTWLRTRLHVAPPVTASHGEARVSTNASQDRVFAVVRDPSAWVRAMTHLERDPDADITTSGTSGQAGYVYAWSSTSSEVVHPRGSIALTAVEPSSLVGMHVVLDGDAGDVVVHVGAAELVVTADLAPKSTLAARAVAELVASAMQDAGVPHAAGHATSPPDLGTAQRPRVSWNVQSCKNAPGCTQNAFSRTCAEAGMKTVRIVVTDDRSHRKTVTRAPCPAGATEGDVAIDVPPGAGPFTVAASSDEVATARSELVCHVTPRCWARGISLNLYALGCNDPECTACIDAGHQPGWCE